MNHFLNPLPIPELISKVGSLLKQRGIDQNLVLPAKATCRDDSIEELGIELSKKGFHNPFHMETLTGLPVCGKTSVGAFYHHIPDQGYGLIFFAPHIGIDETGNLGYIKRHGIEQPGKSCGAQHALLDNFKLNKSANFSDDRELSDVADFLKPQIQEINESEQPLLTLTNTLYEQGLKQLTKFAKETYTKESHKYPIIIVAGINLDTHHDQNNQFDLRSISMITDKVEEIQWQQM